MAMIKFIARHSSVFRKMNVKPFFPKVHSSGILPSCLSNLELEKHQKLQLNSMLACYPYFSETLISLDSRQISIDAQKDFSIIFSNTQEIKLNYNQVISLAITS